MSAPARLQGIQMAWPPARVATLAEQVYEAVRGRIVSGALAPGTFVREKDLEAMGVSRTPIRDALGRLASEGFLERLPHRGFRVPEEPLRQMLDLYPIVAALEVLAGRLALARFAPADVAELRRANEELTAARLRGDADGLSAANARFHAVFSERSGNARLAGLLDDLRQQLAGLERWAYAQGDLADRSIAEHAELIAAIEAGEVDRAVALLERNYAMTLDMVAGSGGARPGQRDG